jgi:hypothetical protein
MSEYRTWEELTEAEQLHQTWSDYHKEVNGFRPRFGTPEELASPGWLKDQIAKLDGYLERTMETVEGRNMLRDEGWVIPGAEEDNWVSHEVLRAEMHAAALAEEAADAMQYPGKDYEYLDLEA